MYEDRLHYVICLTASLLLFPSVSAASAEQYLAVTVEWGFRELHVLTAI